MLHPTTQCKVRYYVMLLREYVYSYCVCIIAYIIGLTCSSLLSRGSLKGLSSNYINAITLIEKFSMVKEEVEFNVVVLFGNCLYHLSSHVNELAKMNLI